ncbi:MAG: glycosyltransferase family 39 protein [Solirubrobacterales bacterium]|nr:glycosyltransferase family 39 protein [Solirubrobacterales bacterium]
MSWGSISYPAPGGASAPARPRAATGRAARLRTLVARPELIGLLALAGVLNLWNLSINGWANTYYAAAVRSMSTSWHDFLFASLDKTGLMTVDKPPLAFWVQALSVRVFGYHPLSILVPEALMGVAAVALVYDMTRRMFGRVAGTVAGLAFALTPITVAMARHNNPDELLVLCSVAALWCTVRALETGRTKWLVLTGVCVGLGFETKMGVALLIVPGIALAWMWSRWGETWRGGRGRIAAFGQLLAGGAAMVAVGGAWPLLVTLTPAADRPWISGTSDNSIWSLIFGYNGLGRVAGQSGGPGGGGGGGFGGNSLFGGATGPFRLIGSALGDQAGWLLGFAVVAGVAIVVVSRMRRRDLRTGWVIAMGGAFLATAVVFSFSAGIFHPYYVSFLAPFAAALVGAGAGLMLPRSLGGTADHTRVTRIVAPLAIAAGAVTELIVLGELNGSLSWAKPLIIGVAGASAVILALDLPRRVRGVVVAVVLAALLAAPATWAAETLGHATSSTFPAGGSASASMGGPGGGFGGGGSAGRSGRGGFSRGAGRFAPPGAGGFTPSTSGGFSPSAAGGFAPPKAGNSGSSQSGAGVAAGGPGGFGNNTEGLTAAVRYAEQHGGGVIGVSSQSSAAAAIVSSDADVAGLGGFSGRESSVTATWLAQEVAAGRLRWVIVDGTQTGGLPGDTRTGSQAAMNIVASTCRRVTLSTSGSTVTMYDCQGRAAAILAAAKG